MSDVVAFKVRNKYEHLFEIKQLVLRSTEILPYEPKTILIIKSLFRFYVKNIKHYLVFSVFNIFEVWTLDQTYHPFEDIILDIFTIFQTLISFTRYYYYLKSIRSLQTAEK